MFNHNFVCFFFDSDKTNSSLCLSNLHSSTYPSTHLSIHLSFIYVLNMHMHTWKREITLYSTCQYALSTKKIKMNEAGISKNKKILLLIPVYLWFYIYHQLFFIIWLNNSMKLDVLNWIAFILVKLIVYRTRNSISLGSPITNTLYERSFLDVYTVTQVLSNSIYCLNMISVFAYLFKPKQNQVVFSHFGGKNWGMVKFFLSITW